MNSAIDKNDGAAAYKSGSTRVISGRHLPSAATLATSPLGKNFWKKPTTGSELPANICTTEPGGNTNAPLFGTVLHFAPMASPISSIKL